MRELGVPVTVARELDEADAVVTLRNLLPPAAVAARRRVAQGVTCSRRTILQMENMLASLFDLEDNRGGRALRETAEAIELVQASVARSSSPRRTPTCGGCSTRWPSATR